MRFRPIVVVASACAGVTLLATGYVLWQHQRGEACVAAAHARLEVSIVEAPDFERMNVGAAIASLNQASEFGRNSPEDVAYRHYAQAIDDLKRGDLILADAELESARARLGWTADLHVVAAALAHRRSNLGVASSHANEALRLDPEHARALLLASDIAADRQHPDEAVAILDRLTRLVPDAAAAFNRRGLAHEALGHAQDARRDYRRAASLDPREASPFVNLGRVLRSEGDHAGSRDAYREAVSRAATDPAAHLGLGLALASLGDAAGAHRELARAMELAPDDAVAVMALGDLSMDVGERDIAIGFYRQAIDRDRTATLAWLKLGNALASTNDVRGARDAYREAISRDASLSAAHNGLGVALMRLNEENAEGSFARASELDPRDPHPWMNLALLREHRGQRTEARHAWRQALALDPSSEVAASRLAALN